MGGTKAHGRLLSVVRKHKDVRVTPRIESEKDLDYPRRRVVFGPPTASVSRIGPGQSRCLQISPRFAEVTE